MGRSWSTSSGSAPHVFRTGVMIATFCDAGRQLRWRDTLRIVQMNGKKTSIISHRTVIGNGSRIQVFIVIIIMISSWRRNQIKLTNRSCGLATEVSGGKICYKSVFKLRRKEAGDDRSSVVWCGRLFQTTGAALQKARLANAIRGFLRSRVLHSLKRSCSLSVWLKRGVEADQTGSQAYIA